MSAGATTPVVVVHGGAGNVAIDRRPAHIEGCRQAARRGLEVLLAGGTSVEAVTEAVAYLENDPLYNAGKGCALTAAGTVELDAAIMDGGDLRAGAVASLPAFANPVRIAKAALEDGRHVLYAGAGARKFAVDNGFDPAEDAALITDLARERLAALQDGSTTDLGPEWAGGTVGAVACDGGGRIAAATSTGGTVGKRVGRIGDTPVLGAGTYADDGGGASATGVGEQIMRFCLAQRAVSLMQQGIPADEAARAVMAAFDRRLASHAGIILLDSRGQVGIARNTATMTHAVARRGQSIVADL